MNCQIPMPPQIAEFCVLFAIPDERGIYRSRADAYLGSHPGGTRQSCHRNAFRLLERADVQAEIRRLRIEHETALGSTLNGAVIAAKAKRILAKQERWSKLRTLIEARGQELGALEDSPAGSETGLLVPVRAAGGVVNYKFDKAVLDALNELEESVARELGQIVEKIDLTVEEKLLTQLNEKVLAMGVRQNGRVGNGVVAK